MRRWLKTVPWLPLLAGGCVTHKLWTESRLDAWNEPAASPNLRLFRDERLNDFLVVYDEFSERHDATRARAFFLNQNERPLPGRPHFVSVNSSRGLTPVPAGLALPTNSLERFCVVTATNSGTFTICSESRPVGSYALPVYDDGWGKIEKTAWTPLAVTADLTIIGGYLGCVWIYAGGPGLNQ